MTIDLLAQAKSATDTFRPDRLLGIVRRIAASRDDPCLVLSGQEGVLHVHSGPSRPA